MPDRATILAATPKCPDCARPMVFLPEVRCYAAPGWRCVKHGSVTAAEFIAARALASA